jgi:hypothetical protein
LPGGSSNTASTTATSIGRKPSNRTVGKEGILVSENFLTRDEAEPGCLTTVGDKNRRIEKETDQQRRQQPGCITRNDFSNPVIWQSA